MQEIYLISQLMKIIISQNKPTVLLIVIILSMEAKEIKTKIYQLKNILI